MVVRAMVRHRKLAVTLAEPFSGGFFILISCQHENSLSRSKAPERKDPGKEALYEYRYGARNLEENKGPEAQAAFFRRFTHYP
jgi:hypothetical protein